MRAAAAAGTAAKPDTDPDADAYPNAYAHPDTYADDSLADARPEHQHANSGQVNDGRDRHA